jgi:hypothetical protein
MSSSDAMLNGYNYVDKVRFQKQIADFGLPTNFARILFNTGAVLAGGAVTNYVYNTLHPTKKIPMNPDSDIDIWVYDPIMNMKEGVDHVHRAYRGLILKEYDTLFREIGMIPSGPKNNSCELYDNLLADFKAQGDTRLHCRWWEHPKTGKRIQLMFMNKPPAEAILLFDLTVCRCLMFVSTAYNFVWDCSIAAKRDILASQLTVPKIKTKNTEERIKKYAERYALAVVDEWPKIVPISNSQWLLYSL